jgi:hypothetical protein
MLMTFKSNVLITELQEKLNASIFQHRSGPVELVQRLECCIYVGCFTGGHDGRGSDGVAEVHDGTRPAQSTGVSLIAGADPGFYVARKILSRLKILKGSCNFQRYRYIITDNLHISGTI